MLFIVDDFLSLFMLMVGDGWWSVPIVPIGPFVFLPEIPSPTERQEQLDRGQHPDEGVEGHDTTDRNKDELGNLVSGISIH